MAHPVLSGRGVGVVGSGLGGGGGGPDAASDWPAGCTTVGGGEAEVVGEAAGSVVLVVVVGAPGAGVALIGGEVGLLVAVAGTSVGPV